MIFFSPNCLDFNLPSLSRDICITYPFYCLLLMACFLLVAISSSLQYSCVSRYNMESWVPKTSSSDSLEKTSLRKVVYQDEWMKCYKKKALPCNMISTEIRCFTTFKTHLWKHILNSWWTAGANGLEWTTKAFHLSDGRRDCHHGSLSSPLLGGSNHSHASFWTALALLALLMSCSPVPPVDLLGTPSLWFQPLAKSYLTNE